MKKTMAVVMIIYFWVGAGFCETYYMANNPCSGNPGWGNGIDDGNRGFDKATPFLTLQYAFSRMTAGDTLVIDDGTYTGSGKLFRNPGVLCQSRDNTPQEQ